MRFSVLWVEEVVHLYNKISFLLNNYASNLDEFIKEFHLYCSFANLPLSQSFFLRILSHFLGDASC